jgi:hypothetical protein
VNSIHHSGIVIKVICLLEHDHTQTIASDHLPVVGLLYPCNKAQKRGFSGTVGPQDSDSRRIFNANINIGQELTRTRECSQRLCA